MGLIHFSQTAAAMPPFELPGILYTDPPPAASALNPDSRPLFSQLLSSPLDLDQSLVETISEDDRATLLPIIRIAFPGFQSSLEDASPAWQSTEDDLVVGVGASEQVKQENEGEREQGKTCVTQDSKESVQGGEWFPTSYGERSVKAEEEEAKKGGDWQRATTKLAKGCCSGHVRERACASVVSRAKDEKPLLLLLQGDGDADRQSACQTEDGSNKREFVPLPVDSNINSLESTEAGAIKVVQLPKRVDSDAATQEHSERAAAGCCTAVGVSPKCGRSHCQDEGGGEEDQQQKMECQEVHLAVPPPDPSTPPDTIQKPKNVTNNSAGLVRSSGTQQAYSSRLSHKRARGSVCCTGCELGSKKRKTSAHNGSGATTTPHGTPRLPTPSKNGSGTTNPHGTPRLSIPSKNGSGASTPYKTPRLSTPSKPKTSTEMKRLRKEQLKALREYGLIMALPASLPETETSHVVQGSSMALEEQEQSLLFRALYPVVLESGSHGVSVCEALRKLLKKGCSMLFKQNSYPRSVQVKRALRKNLEFRELNNCRFVLRRNNRKRVGKKQIGNSIAREHIKGGKKGHKLELIVGPGPKLHVPGEKSQMVVTGCSEDTKGHLQGKKQEIERCHRTNGKQWRCSQKVKQGFMYCEHHQRKRDKKKKEDALRREAAASKGLGQKVPVSGACIEYCSQISANNCLKKDSKDLQGEEKQQIGRCRRRDGKHWQCSRQAKLGSIYCEHHYGRLSKRRAESKGRGKVVAVQQLGQDLPVSEVCMEDLSQAPVDIFSGESKGCSQRQEEQQMERCHRRDGKGWQCAGQAKLGYIYCEHHQGRRIKGKAETSGQGEIASIQQSRGKLDVLRDGIEDLSETLINRSLKESQGQLPVEDQQTEHHNRTGNWTQAMEVSCSDSPGGEQVKQCRRRDGKGWQCAREAKQGFNYCDHHQLHLNRRSTNCKSFKKGKQSQLALSAPTKPCPTTCPTTLPLGCSSGSEVSQSSSMCIPMVQKVAL